MFVRKGQALGSVNYTKLAELRAARPTPKKRSAPEPVAVEPEPEESPEPESQEAEQPKEYAAKPEWVAWAVSQGADEAEAEALTKNELIELYGGAE